jgi:hypothetical protein
VPRLKTSQNSTEISQSASERELQEILPKLKHAQKFLAELKKGVEEGRKKAITQEKDNEGVSGMYGREGRRKRRRRRTEGKGRRKDGG